jgi:(R,R)-butanediol dehydrogenase/meso-butanediol dehydrogenase/diacetyl reductase
VRAAVFKGASQGLAIETIATPDPGPHQLILRVRACGICGSDLHMTEAHSSIVLPAGAVMGHEFSGEIAAIGTALNGRFKEGDRIVGFPYLCGCETPCPDPGYNGDRCPTGLPIGLGQHNGAFADYVRIGGSGARPLPDTVSFEEGALVEPLAVGLHAVERGGVTRGDTVLVVGAGPVGLAIALWCRFSGARHVIVSERAPARMALAERFGATDVLDPAKSLPDQVRAIAGKGPDVIFECVGLPGMIDEMMRIAPRGARIVVAGLCQGLDTFTPLRGVMKELTLQFVVAYTSREFDRVIEMIARDRIDALALITDRISLDDVPDAFERLRTPAGQCKVMVGF